MHPIGPLMHEHRLIERLVRLIVKEAAAIESGRRPDHRFIDNAVDFFKYFADRCHHGKEEKILFKELAAKPLSTDERRILQELIEEHVVGREMVQALRAANQEAAACEDPAPVGRVVTLLRELADFYPRHIEKEDKHFFHPVMRHFSRAEMDKMLADFEDIEKIVLHEKYTAIVEEKEKNLT